MKCVLKYPGAKNRIADWICEYIPPHEVYLEPYFGSGAVFFNKTPARIETVNDLDGNVVNYFRVIRERPQELMTQLEMTPYSRDEYYGSRENLDKDTDIEKARKFAVRCWMGYGASNSYFSGFRSSQQTRSPYTTKEWRNLPERLLAGGGRFKLDGMIRRMYLCMLTLLTYMGHGKIIFTGMRWKTMNILNCWNCLWSIRERYCYLAMTMTCITRCL